MSSNNSSADLDEPTPVRLRIVEVINCASANAPDANGRPISMLTLSHLGELEQPLAISYEDSKLLVTQLLGSLSDHGNDFAEYLLETYFSNGKGGADGGRGGDEDEESDD